MEQSDIEDIIKPYGIITGDETHIYKFLDKYYLTNLDSTDIKKEFIAGKDVFILGYGSSGAGKTSTLIYNKTLKKKGILLELLKEISGYNLKQKKRH